MRSEIYKKIFSDTIIFDILKRRPIMEDLSYDLRKNRFQTDSCMVIGIKITIKMIENCHKFQYSSYEE